jgi:hypothetical protein
MLSQFIILEANIIKNIGLIDSKAKLLSFNRVNLPINTLAWRTWEHDKNRVDQPMKHVEEKILGLDNTQIHKNRPCKPYLKPCLKSQGYWTDFTAGIGFSVQGNTSNDHFFRDSLGDSSR